MSDRKSGISPPIRFVWLLSLCLYAAGCAGAYERVPLQTAAADADHSGADPMGLGIGDQVRITDDNGRKYEGHYGGMRGNSLVLTEAELVETPDTGFPEVTTSDTVRSIGTSEVPLAEIALLEKYDPRSPEPGYDLALGVGAILAIAFSVVYVKNNVSLFDNE